MSAPDIIKRIEDARREREERFDAAPSTVVEACVGASAPAGFGRGDDYSLGVSCAVWRPADGSLEEGSLYIHHPIKREELQRYQGLLSPWTQVRYRVRIDPKRSIYDGTPRADARGEELLDYNLNHPELSTLIHRFQQPVNLRHPRLGRLTLDRAMNRFVGKRHRWFRSYSIEAEAAPDDSCDLEALWEAVKFVEASLDSVLESVADEYLEQYEGWGSPLGTLSRQAFKSKPRLSSLYLNSVGIELYFRDGGLFLGHLFRVHIAGGAVDCVALEG